MSDITQPVGETPTTATPSAMLTWDVWQAGWTAEQKSLFEAQTGGLKKALDAERDEKKGLAKAVKELQSKTEKGSELEAQLAALQTQLETATRRADFVTEAPTRGVANVKAAWTLAQADQLISKDGTVDWDTLKGTYPELFARQPPQPPETNSQVRGSGADGLTQEQLIVKKRASGMYSQL